MKTALAALALACPLVLAGACHAHAAQGNDGARPAPLVAPAAHVPHALRATMLASTRAGTRIVAVGDHGIVLLSDDGGKTHRQARHVPVDVPLTSVAFVDERRGWAVGHWGVVLQTDDGGETWRLQRIDTAVDRPLFAVHFFDAKQGVAVGLWSLVLVTDDGGLHWSAVELQAPEGARRADLNLLGLFSDARGRLFAPAEKGMVLRSDDRGRHWRYLSTGYTGSFWTGVAPSDGALLVAGLRGSMYRSTDDGQTWQRIDTHSKSSVTALAAAGRVVVGVGLDGLVLRSEDAGASFTSQTRGDRLPLTAVTLDDKDRTVLYSRQGVVSGRAADDAGK